MFLVENISCFGTSIALYLTKPLEGPA